MSPKSLNQQKEELPKLVWFEFKEPILINNQD